MRTLIKSDYTFLNERLAKHYGIPGVYGSRFRRVTLTPKASAAGCCGTAACCRSRPMRRTSPVLRGVLVLRNTWARRRLPSAGRAGARRARWPPIFRCASAWLRIAATPCARAVTGRSIRWAFRSRTSMRWDSGGTSRWRSTRRCVGAYPATRSSEGSTDSKTRCAVPNCFRDSDGEPSDVRAGTRRRVLRRACRSQDRERRGEGRIPVLVAHSRNREERSVSNAAR